MAGVVIMLTGCAALDHEPAVQETWEMTYSDYRSEKYNIFSEYLPSNYHKEYYDLTRPVTIERDGDRIAIKGMFPEYPDVWIKGKVVEGYFPAESHNKCYGVFLEKSKVMGVANGESVYFHNGTAICEALKDETSSTLQVSFDTNNGSEDPDFFISDDGNKILKYLWSSNAFWLSNDKESTSKFYTTWQNGRVAGTGFPKMDNYIVNVHFRKISTGNEDTCVTDAD